MCVIDLADYRQRLLDADDLKKRRPRDLSHCLQQERAPKSRAGREVLARVTFWSDRGWLLLTPTAIEGERALFALASVVVGMPVKLGDVMTYEVAGGGRCG
jgi:hypothetical protein